MNAPLKRRWTALSLTLLLMVSTAGIPVHALYCLCKGEWSYALFSADDLSSCGTKGADTCCKPKSCCSDQTEGCRSDAGDEHPCDTGETRVARLQTDFISQFDKEQESAAASGTTAALPVSYDPCPAADLHPPMRPTAADGGPPPRAARHLLYGNFRC